MQVRAPSSAIHELSTSISVSNYFWTKSVTNLYTCSKFNKICPFQSILTVNFKRERDDRLLLIFTSKLGIISLKQHRQNVGNLPRQIYLVQT